MFRIINSLKNRKGFTLIELIVVLAVLAIIAAIAIPRFMGVQEKAKQDADKQTIEMVRKAATLYYVTNNEDTSFTVGDLISAGYLEPFKLQVGNTSYDSTSTKSITINTSTQAVSVSLP